MMTANARAAGPDGAAGWPPSHDTLGSPGWIRESFPAVTLEEEYPFAADDSRSV